MAFSQIYYMYIISNTSSIASIIIIAKYGQDQKDYDRPTNIDKYLNYLKDKKRYDKEVEDVKYDAMGKIIEIELIKK